MSIISEQQVLRPHKIQVKDGSKMYLEVLFSLYLFILINNCNNKITITYYVNILVNDHSTTWSCNMIHFPISLW